MDEAARGGDAMAPNKRGKDTFQPTPYQMRRNVDHTDGRGRLHG